MPVPETINDEWLSEMRKSNLMALQGMANIAEFNQAGIEQSEEE
jgi:hypothetical protein